MNCYFFFKDFVDQVGNKYYVGVSAFVKVQLKVGCSIKIENFIDVIELA